MTQSEYEFYGVKNIERKYQSKSHIEYRDGNCPELEPCFVCGAEATQGWSPLGAFVMCSVKGCLNQLHSRNKNVSQFDLGAAWNRLNNFPGDEGK
jgi:hypothetical protein